ncbi:MAG: hypothetical protein KBA99_09660 [Bacteroidia bacterium]|jgi:hypothetical protein|nr:hypothetical protein [Bacteroidota bacterium]MBP7245554.1 hypothetical protein [Bacteroidia bacterium]
MTAIFNGIATAAESIFPLLPSFGDLINWFFGLTITIGVIYWLWYDAKVKRGGDNYLAKKG